MTASEMDHPLKVHYQYRHINGSGAVLGEFRC